MNDVATQGYLAPLCRRVLAAVVVLDLLSLAWIVGEETARSGAEVGTMIAALASAPLRWTAAFAGTIAAVVFALSPGRLLAGAASLVALAALSTAQAHLYGSPWRHLFFSGLCMLGWLAGLALARARGDGRDESFAFTGAVALLGAAYFNSGLSKLVYGGIDWLGGTTIQTVVLGHDGLVADRWTSALRAWVVSSSGAAAAFSTATVVFELAGPLMLVGRRWRAWVALGLLSMHVTVRLTTDILYPESLILLAVFGFSAGPLHAAGAAPEAYGPVADAQRRRFRVAALALAAVAASAVLYQGQRFRHLAGHEVGVVASPAEAPDPQRQRIGPFVVGQALAEVWTVERIDLLEHSLRVELVSGEDRAAFELTCAPSPYRSPFDLADGAHVFYSSDLDFERIEHLGHRVAELAAPDAPEDSACDQWKLWRLEAQR